MKDEIVCHGPSLALGIDARVLDLACDGPLLAGEAELVGGLARVDRGEDVHDAEPGD
jgi:hypothetical protein